MKKLLLKIYRKLTLLGIKNFNETPCVNEWKKFLYSLPEGDTVEQRSLNRYYCRMHYFGGFYKIIVNGSSIFSLIFLVIPKLFKRNKFLKASTPDAVFVSEIRRDTGILVRYDDIFPEELVQKYSNIKVVENKREKFKISSEAKSIFMRVWRKNFFRPYYSYWVFRELAFYSELAEIYTPQAIIVYIDERNVVSPIITDFLEKKGIKFITFMHGDYIMQLLHGFMEYSEFYVWDKHYVEMFVNDLYCPAKQFKVYTPKKLTKKYSTEHEIVDLTYYLGSESDLAVKRIGNFFRTFKEAGKVCQVRLHPRRDRLNIVLKFIDEDQIQYPTDISVEQSIINSTYIVSLNSTVLLEASKGGKKIIIDDVSDPEQYLNLHERKSINLSREHQLLSDLMKDISS